MKRAAIVSLLALMGGVLLIELVKYDSGYVLISYGNYTAEATFWMMLLTIAAIYSCIWSIKYIVKKGYKKVKRAILGVVDKRAHAAEKMTLEGIEFIAEDNYSVAAKQLISAAKKMPSSVKPLLAASHCYFLDKNYSKALAMLENIEQQDSEYHPAIFIMRAKIYCAQTNYQQALDEMAKLSDQSRLHPQRIRILSFIYHQQKHADKLIALLKDAQLSKAIPQEEYTKLEESAWQLKLKRLVEHSEQVDKQDTLNVLQSTWRKLPRALKHNISICEQYLWCLYALDEHEQAWVYCKQIMPKKWSDNLVETAGCLKVANTKEQLNIAQLWLKKQTPSAVLYMALSAIAQRCELPALAESYLLEADKISPSTTVKKRLGDLFYHKQDLAKALSYYQQL